MVFYTFMAERHRGENPSFINSILTPLIIPTIVAMATSLRFPRGRKVIFKTEGVGRAGEKAYLNRKTNTLHIPSGATVVTFSRGLRILVKDYKKRPKLRDEPKAHIEYGPKNKKEVVDLTVSNQRHVLGNSGIIARYHPDS